MIVIRRMMPVMAVVLVRGRVDRLAIRLRYRLVYVLRFAPHVIRVRLRQPDRGGGGGGGGGRPSPSLAAPSSPSPTLRPRTRRLRLPAHAQSLHLLRAILDDRLLHPALFAALVIRDGSRRRRAVPASLLRGLGGTRGRGGVTRDGGPQRRPLLLVPVFGPLLRLLLLLPDQLLDQTVLIGGYVVRGEQRRDLKNKMVKMVKKMVKMVKMAKMVKMVKSFEEGVSISSSHLPDGTRASPRNRRPGTEGIRIKSVLVRKRLRGLERSRGRRGKSEIFT